MNNNFSYLTTLNEAGYKNRLTIGLYFAMFFTIRWLVSFFHQAMSHESRRLELG